MHPDLGHAHSAAYASCRIGEFFGVDFAGIIGLNKVHDIMVYIVHLHVHMYAHCSPCLSVLHIGDRTSGTQGQHALPPKQMIATVFNVHS